MADTVTPYAGGRKLIAKMVWVLIAALCLFLIAQMPPSGEPRRSIRWIAGADFLGMYENEQISPATS